MTSIFVMEDVGRDDVSVKILEVNKSTSSYVDQFLSFNKSVYKNNAVRFDGSYKPSEDESLKIENFDLANEIVEAVHNSLGVEKLSVSSDVDLNLRAVFKLVNDEEEQIVFQRIKKSQILLSKQWTLMWDRDTFIPAKKPGLVFTDAIDSYYENGTLYFKSYYWANQIFNLNKYYREATDEDIEIFCSSGCVFVKDMHVILESNNWARRKIAYIMDSRVLDHNSTNYIVKTAQSLGLDFSVNEENKIIFPEDSAKQKELLSYLADEIYEGNLTKNIYLTNSKKSLQNKQ